MKYNININQKAIMDNGLDLNINDAIILDFLKDFCRPENLKLDRIEFRGNLYFWVSYPKLLEEMPILSFKTEGQLGRKLKSLEKRHFLIRKTVKAGAKSKVYIALKDSIHQLNFSSQNRHPAFQQRTPCISDELHPAPVQADHIINDHIIKDHTSLGLGIKEILALWNERVAGGGFPQNAPNRPALAKLLPECRRITPEIEQALAALKKYTDEDFKKAILNYCVEILNRNPANDYSRHRFSFYEFFKQKNGFIKFINK